MIYTINNKKFKKIKDAINYQNKLENINKDNFINILQKKIKAIDTKISGK